MKITVEKDDKTTEVYQYVTDCYLSVRQLVPMENEKKEVQMIPEIRSYSWGGNLRDLAKELYQSWIEIQEIIKKVNVKKDANTTAVS